MRKVFAKRAALAALMALLTAVLSFWTVLVMADEEEEFFLLQDFSVADGAVTRITEADINWDNPGKIQKYECAFEEDSGVWGQSSAYVSVGYGEARVEVRKFEQIPWNNDVAVPAGTLGEYQTMYLIYAMDKADAVKNVEITFSTKEKGDPSAASPYVITYAFTPTVVTSESGWAVLKLDMTDRTAEEDSSCIVNTLEEGDLDRQITHVGIHVNYSGIGTDEENPVHFSMDGIYLSKTSNDLSLPEKPVLPTIDASELRTSYDVYGEIADLNKITATTLKDGVEVGLAFAVTDPDGAPVALDDESFGENRFQLTKPGTYTVTVTATNLDAEALSVTETYYITVADPANPPAPNEDKTFWDFEKKAGSLQAGEGGEEHNGILTEFSADGAAAFGDDSITGGAAKISVISSELGTSAAGWAVYEENMPEEMRFRPSDYGAVKIRFYASNPEQIYSIKITFTTEDSGVGDGNKGIKKEIATGTFAFDNETQSWENGWFEYTFDLRSMTTMGGYTYDSDQIFGKWDFIINYWDTASVGDYVILDEMWLLGERYAPTVTLDAEKIQPLLNGETGKEIDLNGVFTAEHPFGVEFSTQYSVVFNGSTAVTVEAAKFTPYRAGEYEVNVIATDVNGAVTAKSFRITVTGEDIDVVDPVINVSGFSLIQATKEIDLSAITVTDDTDPSPTISFEVKDPTGTVLSVIDGKFTATYNGRYSILITAVDASGNDASRTLNLTVNCPDLSTPGGEDSQDPGDNTGNGCNGCGSIVGGSVSGVLALLALAGIALKRKG